jgi:exopolysaccharide biosynthesis WecB/TagA/CpsF family protein
MVVQFPVNDYDLREFIARAERFGVERFAFAVTPNVDHIIRYCDEPAFRRLYADAAFVLLDSRFLARLLFLVRGVRLKSSPGSDITKALFESVIAPEDTVVIVGASAFQVQRLAQRHGLRDVRHHNPPMGFIHDPAAFDACLEFIERASPFRFCFLAVGSPQQEMLAKELLLRGKARGLALCVGASIDFLTGVEKRAPRWLQALGMEWVYRLLQNPRRLAKRYFVRGPRIFMLLPSIRFQRRSPQGVQRLVPRT